MSLLSEETVRYLIRNNSLKDKFIIDSLIEPNDTLLPLIVLNAVSKEGNRRILRKIIISLFRARKLDLIIIFLESVPEFSSSYMSGILSIFERYLTDAETRRKCFLSLIENGILTICPDTIRKIIFLSSRTRADKCILLESFLLSLRNNVEFYFSARKSIIDLFLEYSRLREFVYVKKLLYFVDVDLVFILYPAENEEFYNCVLSENILYDVTLVNEIIEKYPSTITTILLRYDKHIKFVDKETKKKIFKEKLRYPRGIISMLVVDDLIDSLYGESDIDFTEYIQYAIENSNSTMLEHLTTKLPHFNGVNTKSYIIFNNNIYLKDVYCFLLMNKPLNCFLCNVSVNKEVYKRKDGSFKELYCRDCSLHYEDKEAVICLVCHNDEADMSIAKIPCGHLVCYDCIIERLSRIATLYDCPLCGSSWMRNYF